MATVTFQGNPVQTNGDLPAIGSSLPAFELVKTDLSVLTNVDVQGKKVLLNIVPSVDTGVCSDSMKEFNQLIAEKEDIVVVGVSMDLPFAIGRHNTEHGIEKVIGASGFRSNFGEQFGVKITDSALKALYTRAVVVADEQGKVIYTELVSEITTAPNYSAALNA